MPGNSQFRQISGLTAIIVAETAAEFLALTKPFEYGLLTFAKDTKQMKIGDNTTLWGSLDDVNGISLVDALQVRVGSLEDTVSTLDDTVIGLGNAVTALTDRVTTAETSVAALNSVVVTNANQEGGVLILGAGDKVDLAYLPNEVKNRPIIVSDIAARDLIPIAERTSIVLVLDATGDETVGSGMAYYAWPLDAEDWVKVGEAESIDIDFSGFLQNGASLDLLSDSVNYVRMTPAERTAIGDLTTSVATLEGTAADLDDRITAVEGATGGKIGDLSTLTTTAKDDLVSAINEVKATAASELSSAVTDEEAARVLAVANVQAQINELAAGMVFRDQVKVVSDDANLDLSVDVKLSDILPLSDDDPTTLTESDFAVGDYLVHLTSATLAKVILTGGQKYLTTTGVTPLQAGEAFITQYDLTNTPDDLETLAIYSYNGTALVKAADLKWSIATGISLSSSFNATTGNVLPGDSVEAAIAKLFGNQQALDTRLTAAEATLQDVLSANEVYLFTPPDLSAWA